MKIFDREFSGLSQEDVLKRQQLGKTHFVESKTTKTYKEIIFNNIREYALATYNYGNLKNIVKEHNIDVFFKYKRYFA